MTTFQIRPGFLLIDTSTAQGGVHIKRKDLGEETINDGKGKAKDYNGHKEVDHEQIVEESNALVNKARHILGAKYGVAVGGGAGAMISEESLRVVEAEIAALQRDVAALNARAVAEGSARFVRISYIVSRLELDHAANASEIYRAIREKLAKLRDAFRASNFTKIGAAVSACKGLDKLAVGIQADAIRFALDTVEGLRETLHTALDQKQAPEAAGAALDLDAIEGAIAMFTPADEVVSDDSSGGAAPASDDTALGLTVAA